MVTVAGPAAGLTLLLDFDGTVCRGDEPVLEYARQIATTMRGDDGELLLSTVSGLLDNRIRGQEDEHPAIRDVEDGYQAVERLAIALGVPTEKRSAAFLAARRKLTAGELEVETPAGLLELLADIRGQVTVLLVTNSPVAGMAELLGRLGVADLLDEVVCDAGKPTGLDRIVRRALTVAGADGEPHRLLSFGDIWANDLRVPLELGCATAYIDRFDRRAGRAHASASTCEALLDAIRGWSADPSSLVGDR